MRFPRLLPAPQLTAFIALATALTVAVSAPAQYPANNVSLLAQVDLTELGGSAGNDCWGYVSPSGREYALMGVYDKLVVVEITNPTAPIVVGSVGHSPSTWGDVKTYQHYAYVVNESGGGLDVIDLGNIDATTNRVQLVQRVTAGGLSTSHNVAIDTDSGYLYVIGSNLNGGAPVAYDLSDPANPVEAGRWTQPSAAYHHDAHIVTYTSGPYAGRQIEFGFSEGRGVDIVDVTDKSNMFLLSRTAYPNVDYCHQGWTTPDRRYLYLNDELDEGNPGVPTTRTMIFDIEDLSAPQLLGTFTTGLPAIDHNLYVRDCIMFQANYTSGVRVINISDPAQPVEVGYFDTYPANDNRSFDGVWSVYPYFPSGTIIASDFDGGLFVLDPSAAVAASDAIPGGLDFAFPEGRPATASPLGGTLVTVAAEARCDAAVDTSGFMLHVNLGDGWTSAPMTHMDGREFTAPLPPAVCGQTVEYYVSGSTVGGAAATAPAGAPADTYAVLAVGDLSVHTIDSFSTDQGWINGPDSASTGAWIIDNPVGTGAQPEDDHTGRGMQCLFTGQNPGGSQGTDDVDGGTAVVTSPVYDLSSGDAIVSYFRWFYERDLNDDPADGFLAEISNDDGATWTTVEALTTGAGGWEEVRFLVSAFVAPTGQVRLRFSATDGVADGDIVEAAIDDLRIEQYDCPTQSPDFNADGMTDLRDYAFLQTCYTGAGVCPCTPPLYGSTITSACAAADADLDGDIDAEDLAHLVSALSGP